jgi:cytochrome c-type biogenesis protein CcmH/NrfG
LKIKLDVSIALNAYYQANKINPNNPYVWTGIGVALARNGNEQEALQAFEEVLNIDPNSAIAEQERDKLTNANAKLSAGSEN